MVQKRNYPFRKTSFSNAIYSNWWCHHHPPLMGPRTCMKTSSIFGDGAFLNWTVTGSRVISYNWWYLIHSWVLTWALSVNSLSVNSLSVHTVGIFISKEIHILIFHVNTHWSEPMMLTPKAYPVVKIMWCNNYSGTLMQYCPPLKCIVIVYLMDITLIFHTGAHPSRCSS